MPYAYLSKEVDRLIEDALARKLTSIDEINANCDFIRDFIELNGWSVDDYIRMMFGFEINQN